MNWNISYGYRVKDGELVIHPQEAAVVRDVFDFYLEGMSQQQIADEQNADGIIYSQEHPQWTRVIVSKTLQNYRYIGEDGYPEVIDSATFHAVQKMLDDRFRKHLDHPALHLKNMLRCQSCGLGLRRIAATCWNDTLRFICGQCGMKVTIPDAVLLAEIERQAAEYEEHYDEITSDAPYNPSEAVVRLNNAINRGLERPEQPEDIISLILQGIAARYDCLPTKISRDEFHHLIKEKKYKQAIAYITISADNAVTVSFKR